MLPPASSTLFVSAAAVSPGNDTEMPPASAAPPLFFTVTSTVAHSPSATAGVDVIDRICGAGTVTATVRCVTHQPCWSVAPDEGALVTTPPAIIADLR